MVNPDELYPTPSHIAQRMAAKLNLGRSDYNRKAYVLDPSAGTGNLLVAVKPKPADEWRRGDPHQHIECYAIEIEPELRAVLEDKGYPVVGTDFLTYEPRLQYTHMIMNPPFSHACDHLTHAWDILVEGEIVSLFPVTSLEGKTVKERLILDLIDQYGAVEMLGPVFARAAKPTNAEIAMIHLTKKPQDGLDGLEFDVNNTRRMEKETDWTEQEGTDLVAGGFIAQLLQHADASIASYAAYNQARQAIKRHMSPFNSHHAGQKGILETADNEGTPAQRYNTYVQLITESAWNTVLGHPRFQALLTDRARKIMEKFRQSQKRVDFNEENVRAMFAALFMKQEELMDAAVQDAFDTMTMYHKENRVHVEGWKSDLAWKASRKIILPGYVTYEGYSGFHVNYYRRESLIDIDRAMCVVTGKDFSSIQTVYHGLEMAFQNKHQKWATSEFFDIKYFVKGTVHLTFKDTLEWEQFNIAAARGRKWVGGGFA